jgi:hypothetical protein
MRRRDLLQAAAMAAALPLAPRPRRKRRDAGDAWTFALDDRLRWTLAPSRGEPVVAGGEIAVEFAGAPPIPLRALDGLRRFRYGGGNAPAGWSVVGVARGVEVTARFEDGRPAAGPPAREPAWPQVAVSLRGLDDDVSLVALHFLDSGTARVPALGRTGAPTHRRTDPATRPSAGRALLVNGYQSWSACRVVTAGGPEEVTGHWQLATLGERTGAATRRRTVRRGGPPVPAGLGLAFGTEDGGAGRFTLGKAGVCAFSHFGRRLLGASYPPALATLSILPSDTPLDALGALAARAREAPLPDAVPAGWCSWYELYGGVTEADVLANLALARATFDPRSFRVIQVDDGFQRATGDWDTNAKFPHGHRWLTDAIHAAGFQAGLWLAPFAVADRSGIPVARPHWLLRDDAGAPLLFATREDWGGRIYALDAAQREVQDHLRDLMRHATAEWGYDYLKLDFLHYGAEGTSAGRWQSGAEAYRAGLRAMREGAGRAFLLGCGAPLQHAVGLFDGMRIGEDVDASWEGIQPAAAAALRRAHLHRRAWLDDPDALVVREPLTMDEARAWASVVALSGQMTLASDRMDRLSPERLELLKRTMPVAPVAARACDLATPERVTAPALWAGSARVADLPARWRFRPGDDPAWSDPGLDDGGWEQIAAGSPWEEAGHPGLDGFAWYRARFTAPRHASAGSLALEIGRIDDADETYLNGRRIGASGAMPPAYATDWQGYRRYAVPRDAVRWGRDNVVAIRVYDGGGPGGLYSFRRDRPPAWLLAPVRADWWMLGAVNWDDEPRRMALDLAALGLDGPLVAYDVWQDARVGDVDGRWAGLIAPHSATVLSLRRRPRAPCVIGATRHIVQGAVDLADERWDAKRMVLSGRAVRLDERPYAVTLALPAGFAARSCRGDADCRIETGAPTHEERRTASGPPSVRLVFPAPAGRDLSWEVAFGKAGRR